MRVGSTTAEFGGFRSFFWPIHRWELKKFLPMFFMHFLIAFNYNALRSNKDGMIVTASDAGAAVLPHIKFWAILPGAFLLTFLFTRLSNRFSREKVFYIMMGVFLGFFLLFAFVLFPNKEFLHPHAFAERMDQVFPAALKSFIPVFRNWTLTLFYMMAELWSTAIMAVLFWGIANEITNVGEAKRYYILWSIGANISGIFSGYATAYFTQDIAVAWFPFGKTPEEQSICILSLAVVVSGLITMLIFRWLNTHVIQKEQKVRVSESPPPKMKLSMRKSFLYLARSKYLLCLALIVLCYNVGMNLVEVAWKEQIKQLYPKSNDFRAYMGQVTAINGIIATLISIFITGYVLRKLSWTVSALFTPLFTLIPALGFFFFAMFQEVNLSWMAALSGSSPLVMSVFLGSVHNCATRACKYTIFDASKEISLIPLSRESRLKGKAAIDGVGSRIGKSGGALIYQILFFLFSTSSIAATIPVVCVIFAGIILIWVLSTVSLGRQFDALTSEKGSVEIVSSSARKDKPALSTNG